MTGEYLTNQHQNQTQLQPKLHPPPLHVVPFPPHLQLSRDSEDDTAKPKPSSSTDGATIEVFRRRRGRPPGSKNKPKPPVFITRDPEPVMSPYILEISSGNDVVETITGFCRRKNIGVSVLSGSGSVANVTLRQPCNNSGATITFHGRFDILSISATLLPQTMPFNVPDHFTISVVAGPQCQIVGGLVAGSLVAAGTVFVIASSFNNASYHRLPDEEEARNSGSGGNGEAQSPSGQGGESGNNNSGQGGGGDVPMYSCHQSSDFMWAPAARLPPSAPHY